MTYASYSPMVQKYNMFLYMYTLIKRWIKHEKCKLVNLFKGYSETLHNSQNKAYLGLAFSCSGMLTKVGFPMFVLSSQLKI